LIDPTPDYHSLQVSIMPQKASVFLSWQKWGTLLTKVKAFFRVENKTIKESLVVLAREQSNFGAENLKRKIFSINLNLIAL